MALSSEQFEALFGVSDGTQRSARVRISTRMFSHLGDSICAGPTTAGRALSAAEIWARLTPAQLVELARSGRLDLPFTLIQVGEDIARRRITLNLEVRQAARQAQLNSNVARKIEQGRCPDVLSIERYAAALGLDEHRIGVSRLDHGGDLAVRLRDLRLGRDTARGLSASAVAVLSNASWIGATQSRLSRWQGLPQGPRCEQFGPDPDYGSDTHPAWEAGFRLAHRTREILGLTEDEPIESLRRLVEERLRIPLIQTDLPRHIAGATLSYGEGRVIVVNTAGDNQNEWVRRATIAHELGHLLWDPDERLKHLIVDQYQVLADLSGTRSPRYDPIEARANAFAIEFLCPKAAVVREMSSASDLTHALRNLMERYGVSMTATRQHMWNATNSGLYPPSLVASAEPTDAWKAQESFTVDWFPIARTSPARRGTFAGLTARAALVGHISSETAASYLEAEDTLQDGRLNTVLELYDHVARLKQAPLAPTIEASASPTLRQPTEDGGAADVHPLIASRRWLVAHAREYPSRWVALDGGQLLAHDETLAGLKANLNRLGRRLTDVFFLQIGAEFAVS